MTLRASFRAAAYPLVLSGLLLGMPLAPASAQYKKGDPYHRIGEARFWGRCDFDRYLLNFDTCEGFPSFDPFDASKSVEAGKWIRTRKWEGQSTSTLREGGAALSMRLIRNPHHIPLKRLNRRGMVFAHLQLDPEGPADPRYRIGGDFTRGKGFTKDFYIVVGPYEEAKDGNLQSRQIARWQLYGLNTSGAFVRIGAEGSFRWCAAGAMRHHSKLAIPASCARRHELAVLESRLGTAVFLDLLNKALVTPASDARLTPQDKVLLNTAASEAKTLDASLPCGVGCCIAETEFGK